MKINPIFMTFIKKISFFKYKEFNHLIVKKQSKSKIKITLIKIILKDIILNQIIIQIIIQMII